MAQPDGTESGARELTLVSETIGATRFFAIVFIVVGAGFIALGLVQPDPLWFLLGGGASLALGLLSLLSIAGGFPRLRISGNTLWLQTRWGGSKPLDLAELGSAHVYEVEMAQGYTSRRDLYLGFLRRNEEQALVESGKPIPRERSAFYKSVPISTLIGANRQRAEALAATVNSHRPAGAPALTEAQRALLVSRFGTRRRFYMLLSVGLFAVLILAVFLLRSLG